ncbi:MAG: hypothetical protein IJT34_04280 [Butyrivibrio sp.]|nr:hypothetical protein [Butyrivibrio sp.]
MKRGCRKVAPALIVALVAGLAMPNMAYAYPYQGRTYQYAGNSNLANQKVEADKARIYGDLSVLEKLSDASSGAGSTSYVEMLMDATGADDEAGELAVFKDVTFGGKSVLDQQGIEDLRKIKPMTVTVGRLKVIMADGYKLKEIELGGLQENKKGELEFVLKRVRSDEQVTLSTVLPADESVKYAPTQMKVTYYDNAKKKNREVYLTIYSEVREKDRDRDKDKEKD